MRQQHGLRRRGFGVTALAGTLILGACSYLVFLKPEAVPRPRGRTSVVRGPAFAAASARTTIDPTVDWSTYNNTFDGQRYSPLAQITASNVALLRPVCTVDLGTRTNMQTGPIVVDGTMYFTTVTDTYAVDAASCALRWKHGYDGALQAPFDPNKVNRGAAYLDGRIFRGSNDGRLMALDARTGEEVWNAIAGNPDDGETFPAAPVAWRGLVFIGNAGGDNYGVIGRMMAFDARTGARVWSFDLVPQSGPASQSWPAQTERLPKAGGASWTSYAIDTVAGTVYVPTGNAGPDFLGDARPGANLYAYSVVALDMKNGALEKWYQLLARDVHDWDIAAAPSLVTLRDRRRLVIAAGKDGHIYGTDRETGQRAYVTPVSTIENAEAPLTASGTHFCPGVNGGVEWNGPAYSPTTDLLYVGSIDWCTTVKVLPVAELKDKRGLPWTGSSQLFAPFGTNDATRRGWLTAVSATDGSVRWRYASPTPLIAGVTATAGGLVFSGDLDGTVFALDAATGAVRFRSATGQPIGGGVISYSAGGKQYIAVASGMHSPTSWKLTSTPAKVIVFALP